MSDGPACYPGQAPIDAYGNGGFRFADMSHQGSLLCLPGGIYAWTVQNYSDINPHSFSQVFADPHTIEFLLLGTGLAQQFPGSDIKEVFQEKGIGLEVMDTGAACRTYNVLLREARAVAAALIAVE